jgi:putative spermidine/putrescine transport system ATP-binding protein
MMTSAAQIDFQGLTKYYGRTLGVGPLNLSVKPGEFVSLVGPSGCGKTTTLRLIAGLEQPTSGVLRIDGKVVNDTPTHRRNIGLVFQNYALFPHLTIFANVAFGLRYRGIRGSEMEDRVAEVLKLVNLKGLEKRMPRQLSGGQQQRVGLARAIVIEPSVLLFDEPLSNLDMALRQRMQEEIKRVQQEVGITAVYVTHDQNEAMALSDRVAILFDGKLHQYSDPIALYERPETAEVANFIGEINYLEGEIRDRDSGVFRTERGTILDLPADAVVSAGRTRLAIRPHRVRVRLSEEAAAPNVFEVRIEQSIYSGDMIRAVVRLPAGDTLRIQAHNLHDVRKRLLAESALIELRPEDLQFFPSPEAR